MIDDIIVIGDIHGDMRAIQKYIKMYDLRDCTLVQVGDFGYSFSGRLQSEEEFLSSLRYFNLQFKARNITLVAIRGNHDNPHYFNGNVTMSNLLLIPDYTSIEMPNGENWLFVGGATSIDRLDRTEGKTWWKDEVFHFDLADENRLEYLLNLTKNKAFDVVVTHTAPHDVMSYRLAGRTETYTEYCKNDKNLNTDVLVELNAVNRLMVSISEQATYKPKKWYFGHFHKSMEIDHNDTKFVCLGLKPDTDYPEFLLHKF